MKINSANNTHFNGIKIATAKIKTGAHQDEYKIYKITPKDSEFLEKLYTSINLGKLYDNLNDYQYEVWDWVLEQGLCKSGVTGKYKSLLIADKKNRPFGIVNYSEDKISTMKYLCTWPVEPNKRKPLGGKTLIMEMFRQLTCNNVEKVEVQALKYSVFNPIDKYTEMGFKAINTKKTLQNMTITTQNIFDTMKNFKDKIRIKPIKKQNEINLFDELIINKK